MLEGIYILIELGLRMNVDMTESLWSRCNNNNITIATILRRSHNILFTYIFLKCHLFPLTQLSVLQNELSINILNVQFEFQLDIFPTRFLPHNSFNRTIQDPFPVPTDNKNHFEGDIYDIVVLVEWLVCSNSTFSIFFCFLFYKNKNGFSPKRINFDVAPISFR